MPPEPRSIFLAAKEKKWRRRYADFYHEQAAFFFDCVLRVLPTQVCRVLDPRFEVCWQTAVAGILLTHTRTCTRARMIEPFRL
jgi:hypothetical protein